MCNLIAQVFFFFNIQHLLVQNSDNDEFSVEQYKVPAFKELTVKERR